MCLYITTTCPGNCGTPLFNNELITACEASAIDPPLENFSETHHIDHGVVPLFPNEMDHRLLQGYTCSEPSCSLHPSAITTDDPSILFRCPGCGIAHTWTGDAWAETWVGQSGLAVSFLHRSRWAGFRCSQRAYCHFGAAREDAVSDMMRDTAAKAIEKKSGASWTEEDVEMLRNMKAQGDSDRTIAAALDRTESAIMAKFSHVRKADKKAASQAANAS